MQFDNKKIIVNICIIVFGLLAALSGILSKRIIFIELYSDSNVNKLENFDTYSYFEFMFFFVLVIALICIYYNTTKAVNFSWRNISNVNNKYIGYAAIIFIMWLPYFLAIYPGSALTDSLYEIHNFENAVTQHPWLHCLFLLAGYNIGLVLGNVELGFALTNIIQMVILASAISCTLTWIEKRGCPHWLVIILLLYYGIVPNIANMSFVAIKDVLYSCAIMIFIPFCYDYCTGTKSLYKLLVTITFIVLLRNNGSYVILAMLLVSGIILKKKSFKFIRLSILIVLLCGIPNFILSHFYHKEQQFEEAVGIPIQQVACIIANNASLTNEENEFFNTIYPIELFKINYAPFTVDRIKCDGRFNRVLLQSNKAEFLSKWYGLIRRYPLLALKAQLMETYGFWSIIEFNSNQSNFAIPVDKQLIEHGIPRFSLMTSKPLSEATKRIVGMTTHDFIPLKLRAHIAWFLSRHNDFLPVGACVIILLTAMLDLYRRNKSRYILCLTPLFFNWAVMLIATPIAFAYRYVFSFSLCLPLALLLPYLDDGSANTEAAEAVDTTAGECKADTGTEA